MSNASTQFIAPVCVCLPLSPVPLPTQKISRRNPTIQALHNLCFPSWGSCLELHGILPKPNSQSVNPGWEFQLSEQPEGVWDLVNTKSQAAHPHPTPLLSVPGTGAHVCHSWLICNWDSLIHQLSASSAGRNIREKRDSSAICNAKIDSRQEF